MINFKAYYDQTVSNSIEFLRLDSKTFDSWILNRLNYLANSHEVLGIELREDTTYILLYNIHEL